MPCVMMENDSLIGKQQLGTLKIRCADELLEGKLGRAREIWVKPSIIIRAAEQRPPHIGMSYR